MGKTFFAMLLLGIGEASQAAAGPARAYLDYTATLIVRAGQQVPACTAAAEAAAARVIAGGKLYVTGADAGFIAEASGRAGGLMLLRSLPANEAGAPGDVALIAPMPGVADAARCRALRQAGVLVIAFGTGADFPADYCLPSLAAPGDCLFTVLKETRICPTTALSAVVQLWTWTGEFVAACTRRGKMPAMWQSIKVPGSRERNEPLRATPFDSRQVVPPVAPGKLGAAYLTALSQCVQGLQTRELAHLEQIAVRAAAALQAGHTAYCWLDGHLPPHVVGGPGDPGYFRRLPAASSLTGLGAGDFVLVIGYTGIPEAVRDAVTGAGAEAAWVVAPTGPAPHGALFVDQQWRLGDAVVPVPGYDIAIISPSAVTQLACYWAIVGEVSARRQAAHE